MNKAPPTSSVKESKLMTGSYGECPDQLDVNRLLIKKGINWQSPVRVPKDTFGA